MDTVWDTGGDSGCRMFNNWNAAKHNYKSEKLLEMFSKWNTKQKQAEKSKAKLNQALNIKNKRKGPKKKAKKNLRTRGGTWVSASGSAIESGAGVRLAQRNSTAGAEAEEVQVKVGCLQARHGGRHLWISEFPVNVTDIKMF